MPKKLKWLYDNDFMRHYDNDFIRHYDNDFMRHI